MTNSFWKSVVDGMGFGALWRRLAEWRRRRQWPPELQLEHLRQMIQEDHRWLAHDRVANALTSRYLAALEDDWHNRVHPRSSTIRQELNLYPDHTKDT